MRSRALTDLAKLRELEAERAAVRERLHFQKSKADWIQERINKGYEGDVEKLWETAQKQNTEAAAAQRLDGLIAAQRRQVAHYRRGAMAAAAGLPERETPTIAGGLSHETRHRPDRAA